MTNIQKYLEKQSTSSLFSGDSNEQHDGKYWLLKGASVFFPVAAANFVKDDIDPELIAQFCIEAAVNVLSDLSPPERDAELLRLLQLYLSESPQKDQSKSRM